MPLQKYRCGFRTMFSTNANQVAQVILDAVIVKIYR